MSTDALTQLLQRAEAVLARFEATLPPPLPEIDWQATAFRCRKMVGDVVISKLSHSHTAYR